MKLDKLDLEKFYLLLVEYAIVILCYMEKVNLIMKFIVSKIFFLCFVLDIIFVFILNDMNVLEGFRKVYRKVYWNYLKVL